MPPALPPSPPARRAVLPGLLLVAAVVLVYLGTLSHEFIWDDDLHVFANPRIIGPEGLREIWTTAAANYFPLVLTNFWVQHALWGLAPAGYHAVTILCHAACAVLLWRVLLALGVRTAGAWLGAALWALHPIQVESVAWISELKNTQSGVFFLLSIFLWLKWLGVGRGLSPTSDAGWLNASGIKPDLQLKAPYFLSLACALLAILSKPSTVMLPVALALCTWWRRGAFRPRDLVPLIPFFALSALASGWAIWEQRVHSGAHGPEWEQTLPERVVIAGKTTWFYLGKLLWPHPLTFIYPRWAISAGLLDLLPAVAALATLGVLAWRREAARGVFLAAAFFVALLFPVLGFFSVYFFRYSFVGDHFQYLASLGPLALLGAGFARLPRRAFTATAVAVLLGCGVLTWRQAAIYRDNITLWRATVTNNPDAVMAWLNLGDSCSRAKRFPESIAAYREALRRRPTDADGHNDLGCVLTLVGDADRAIESLRRAIALKPAMAPAHNNLGNAYRAAGRRADALASYAEAIRLQPDYADAHNNLGAEFAEARRHGEAIAHFETALRLKPGEAKTRENLVRALHAHGVALSSGGRWREAAATFRRAVELVPASGPMHGVLAVALVNSDRLEEAVPVFQDALRLDPNSAELRDNFGQVLRTLGRAREAFEQMEEAARLRREGPPRK